jgi:L-lactate dehydrogenase
VLAGEHGIDGVALTVPVTLGDGGVAAVHGCELTAEQAAGLRAGADAVRGALGAVELA